MPIVNEHGVLKIDNKDRKGPGRALSAPWRTRKAPPKSSPEDLARKQAERQERKEKMVENINFVRQLVWELMDCLHDDFPEHTAEWFYQTIMQQPKWTAKQRAISRWNTFLSQQITQYNSMKGMS